MNSLVVAAIVEFGEKVLVGKKLECEHPAGLGGQWHLPGGRMEKGETPSQAIIREMKEETGLDVEIIDMLGAKKSGITGSIILWFLCRSGSGQLVPDDDLEKAEWLTKQQVIERCPDVAKDAWSKEIWEFLKK
jgi:8-oxo-dGTP diphosphatase